MTVLQRRSDQIVLVFLALVLVIRAAFVLSGSAERIVQYVPDDSFYYLQLAKNKAALDTWTFDGVEPATGFHPLLAYLLTVVFTVLGAETSWLHIAVGLSMLNSIMLIGAAALLLSLMRRLFLAYRWAVVLPFLTPAVLSLSTFIMESSFVVLCTASMIYLVCRAADSNASKIYLVTFLVAAIMPWVRSDTGILVFAVFCGSCVYYVAIRNARVPLVSFGALAVAVLSTSALLLHNYLISGDHVQSSAEMKLHWSELQGHSSVPALNRIMQLTVPLAEFVSGRIALIVTAGTLLLFLAGLGFALLRRSPNSEVAHLDAPVHAARRLVLSSALIAVLGYMAFYRHNGALQIWYVSSFLVPFAIAFTFLVDLIARRVPVLMYAMAAGYLLALPFSLAPLWPHQAGMYRAGLHLRQDEFAGKVIAAWNAGIVGYISQRDVVNLDGLVNDTVYEFVVSGTLKDYMQSRDISFIVDRPEMLTNERRLRRSGLSKQEAEVCFEELETLYKGERRRVLYAFNCPGT